MLNPFRLAVAFLTRLPVGPPHPTGPQLGKSSGWFTLVGLGLGLALAALLWLLCLGLVRGPGDAVGFALAAGLATAAYSWASGGLHLDGLADCLDGLGSREATPEGRLRVMADSGLGAYGAMGLVFDLGIKTLLLAALAQKELWWAVVAGPAAARLAPTWLLARYPAAKPKGLALAFSRHTGWPQVALAAVWLALALGGLALPWPMGGVGLGGADWVWPGLAEEARPLMLVATVTALAVGGWWGRRFNRLLGGVTGDVCGGAVELGELLFWLVVLLSV